MACVCAWIPGLVRYFTYTAPLSLRGLDTPPPLPLLLAPHPQHELPSPTSLSPCLLLVSSAWGFSLASFRRLPGGFVGTMEGHRCGLLVPARLIPAGPNTLAQHAGWAFGFFMGKRVGKPSLPICLHSLSKLKRLIIKEKKFFLYAFKLTCCVPPKVHVTCSSRIPPKRVYSCCIPPEVHQLILKVKPSFTNSLAFHLK